MNSLIRYSLLLVTSSVLILMSGSTLSDNKVEPYKKPDRAWISINGEIKSVSADSFILDYGEGVIIVEMDDGDRDADGYKLLPGDRVSVSGRIDDNFFNKTTIEALSVYVEKLNTYFYASAADEEGDPVDYSVWYRSPLRAGQLSLQGTVSKVNGDEFLLDTGLQKVTVDIDTMGYDPLDDEGYQRIDEGDVVRIYGYIDTDIFEDHEVKALRAIILEQNS